MGWVSFDHDSIGVRERYKLLSGAIVPRPIALITTISPEGMVNTAPFSFFNVLSADPGVVAIGLESNDDGTLKDTSRNIRENGEFVVNLVNRELAQAMKTCAAAFASGIEEHARAGLKWTASDVIAPPRLDAAPAAFECARHISLEVSASRQIVLGMVRRLHFQEEVIDPVNMRIDQRSLDLIGRLAGPSYVGLGDMFDL